MLTDTRLHGPLRRTRQLCVHCHENPAGFWVSAAGGMTRRPWCLCCCHELDRARHDIVPFGDWGRRGGRSGRGGPGGRSQPGWRR